MDRIWNVLDVGSIWMKEFAAALQVEEKVNAWVPDFGYFKMFERNSRHETLTHPPLQTYVFPLQRGYSHKLMQRVAPFQRNLLHTLLRETPEPHTSPLVCSSPFYEPVAALWPGPVVYYSTDLTVAYPNLKPKQVSELDRRLCARATFVCPNSRRIAQYFVREAFCSPDKLQVIPNATRASNIAAAPLLHPQPLPAALEHIRKPVVGVIGDLSGNMDWILLEKALELNASFQWVFVGPTHPILDSDQSRARTEVQKRALFLGMKPYGELQAYARCFDVAVLPYRKLEPTFSGSSTRFYEHLAACRPMIGTRGFAELQEKGSLIFLVDTAEELVAQLLLLQQSGFADGCEALRWYASKEATWTARAQSMLQLFRSTPSDSPANAQQSATVTFAGSFAVHGVVRGQALL